MFEVIWDAGNEPAGRVGPDARARHGSCAHEFCCTLSWVATSAIAWLQPVSATEAHLCCQMEGSRIPIIYPHPQKRGSPEHFLC